MMARLPPLSPDQFFWNGECALLRIMIQMWKKNLSGYSNQMALSFLRHCVSKDWVYIVDMSDSLESCLQTFALYSSNEELYLRRILEEMRSYDMSKIYKGDKTMLTFFEKSIMKISRLNSAYLLDFATAQQLVCKLSDVTLRRRFTEELVELRDVTSDTHTTNNYLVTMKQIIHKARISIDNNLDINEINRVSIGNARNNSACASAYPVHTNNTETIQGNSSQTNGDNNQPRGVKRQAENQDDWRGNPVDFSQHIP